MKIYRGIHLRKGNTGNNTHAPDEEISSVYIQRRNSTVETDIYAQPPSLQTKEKGWEVHLEEKWFIQGLWDRTDLEQPWIGVGLCTVTSRKICVFRPRPGQYLGDNVGGWFFRTGVCHSPLGHQQECWLGGVTKATSLDDEFSLVFIFFLPLPQWPWHVSTTEDRRISDFWIVLTMCV